MGHETSSMMQATGGDADSNHSTSSAEAGPVAFVSWDLHLLHLPQKPF